MAEDLTFNILARDQASSSFRSVGNEALKASGKVDIAAASLALWDDTAQKQGKAANTSTAAMKSHAAAAKLLADAENVLAGKATVTTKLIADQGRELDKTAKNTENLAQAAGNAAPNLGAMASPLGAAVAAGVALAPVLVTVGTGLAGLAAAAYGVAKPIENAAQKTGGLQANLQSLDPEQRRVAQGLLVLGDQFQGFQKALEPTILRDFSAGLRLAGGLMRDVEPVAAATGKALGGLLGQIDQEFQSNNWQNFFQFMARTAGPDIHLLGNAFVSLAQDLPPLLEALQPVATSLLQITTYAGDAIRAAQLASTNFQGLGKAAQQSGDGFNATTEGAKAAIPGLEYVSKLSHEVGQGLDILYGNSGKAAKGTQDLAAKARDEAAASQAQTAAINKLNATITTHIAKVLTLEGDEVSWKQAQQAATTAVNQNSHALDGNSKSALAARGAIIQSTSAVIKFADDSNTSTGALHRGSSALQDQIGWLERHAGKSAIARQEIRLLREEEAKIKREIDQRLKVTGTGSYKVSFGSNPVNNPIGKLAAGGRVPGYGGGDRFPALLEGGETIVPKHLTPAVAPLMAAHGVPGFAQGGIIPSYSGGIPGLGPWAVHNTTATLISLDRAVAKATASALTAFPGVGGPANANAAAAQRIAAGALGAFGWGASQMGPLIALWNRESGWNRFARNPSSGAYGIPQALPPTKMPFAAQAAGGSSASAQIGWGLGYIKTRPGYGSPAAAWAHEEAFGWYDKGGWLPPGVSLAVNNTGYPEQVVPPGRSGSTGQKVVLEFRTRSGATDLERAIVEMVRHTVQVNGGDVQVALGVAN